MARRPVFRILTAPVAATVTVSTAPAASAAGMRFDLDSADIPALQARMSAGKLTAAGLTSTVGHKPSLGLVSRTGVVLEAGRIGVPGPAHRVPPGHRSLSGHAP